MRTDPHAACANAEEKAGWAFIHDGLCHPLMAFTGWSTWAVQLHNWTSRLAWPRPTSQIPTVRRVGTWCHGIVKATEVASGLWSVQHPTVGHAVRVKAANEFDAVTQAEHWFMSLQEVGIKPPLLDYAQQHHHPISTNLPTQEPHHGN